MLEAQDSSCRGVQLPVAPAFGRQRALGHRLYLDRQSFVRRRSPSSTIWLTSVSTNRPAAKVSWFNPKSSCPTGVTLMVSMSGRTIGVASKRYMS
jgi:hypothetical protein